MLWDVLPAGEFLGGAPLNVAAHLARLGVQARLVSRVGDDPRGRAALARATELGVDVAGVQRDATRPTGTAEAVLDSDGTAAYRFPAPAAWDAIEADTQALALAAAAGAVVYGTLAQRAAPSAAAIQRLVGVARWRVFDANLRAPHVDAAIALRALERADFVKLNEDEVHRYAAWLGVPAEPAALQRALAARYGTGSLCVTEGARGARLWHAGRYVEQPAVAIEVVDTIGAGDAFLAMLLAELLGGSDVAAAMQRAARLAAFVASQRGATPAYDAAALRR